MNKPIWEPSTQSIEKANLKKYQRWLASHLNVHTSSYEQLWQWSVNHFERFWASLWDYFGIIHDGSYKAVVSSEGMPGVQWFDGAQVNYAEHVLRNATQQTTAIVYAEEEEVIREISWNELTQSTASFRFFLKELGIQQGDCIAAYIPCCPEATMAFLAASSLGAIWSSCSPDFGAQAIIDRFAQIQPKVMVATRYQLHRGKKIDKVQSAEAIAKAIPSIKTIVWLHEAPQHSSTLLQIGWNEIMRGPIRAMDFVRVPFNHPLWVLYSSGTTGLPKAIAHSHGGILLEQLKYGTFHHDIEPGERFFWYTTTGWMMWNHLQASLLCGGTMVLYNGSPSYPNMGVLWKLIQDTGIHHFGTSAGYIMASKKYDVHPHKKFDLSKLREIGSTGSPLPSDGFQWIYEEVKSDVWLTSMSGGTDVCTAFVGGNPLLPIHKGEIQCIALGCAVGAWDEQGSPVQKGTMGEMVISKPMPSMPIYLWDDPNYIRYKKSYFEWHANTWRHGDWITITSHSGVVIHGRSDSTLNKDGIRIGTSEIYRAIMQIDAIEDSLIICVQTAQGNFYMPLFVVLKDGALLSSKLKIHIRNVIQKSYSPRHIPDEIVQAPDVPYTMSGKKTEVPIKKIFMGYKPEEVMNIGALRNPESIKFYVDFYLQKKESLKR